MTFAAVGGLQVLIDWACFVVLSWLGLGVVASNVAGRIVGAVLGFWLNGRFTFGSREASKTGRKQMFKFAIGWLVTALLSTLAVHALEHYQSLRFAWIGKPVIDVLIAALGFLLSKYWIFK